MSSASLSLHVAVTVLYDRRISGHPGWGLVRGFVAPYLACDISTTSGSDTREARWKSAMARAGFQRMQALPAYRAQRAGLPVTQL